MPLILPVEDAPKYAFPFKRVEPASLDFDKCMEIWTKIGKDVDLLDDETIKNPGPFFSSIVAGQTLMYELGDGAGLFWVFGINAPKGAWCNIIIWNPVALRRKVGPWKDAAGDALAWVMDGLKINKLRAYVAPTNTRSRKLIQRFGFKEEGVLRGEVSRRGRLEDVVAYGILREEIE